MSLGGRVSSALTHVVMFASAVAVAVGVGVTVMIVVLDVVFVIAHVDIDHVFC